jgi:membrane protease YdiL (CAAX protease family)
MKVPENTTQVPSAPPQLEWPARNQPVAPWWHTALLAAIIIGVSALSGVNAHNLAAIHGTRVRQYVLTIVWELALGLLTLWGLHIRRTPLRQIYGTRRSGAREWITDIAIAIIFWILAMVSLGAIGALLRHFHLVPAEKIVAAIAPQTIPQAAVWLILCITAGIVEEFVFRGYLLQQFSSLPIGGTRAKLIAGTLASSLLFGTAHGYEGIGGMIAITAYGAMFCILAIYRRSLRPGIIAHAWQDSFTGIAVAVLRSAHMI